MTKPDVSRRYAPGIDLGFKFNFLQPDLVQTRKSVIPTNAFDHHCTSSFEHTPQRTLRQLPVINSMQTEFGGRVVVSPDGLACSTTGVNVESTYSELHARLKRQFDADLDARLAEMVDKKVQECVKSQTQWIQYIHRAHAIRNIEDWSIRYIKRALNLPDTDNTSFRDHVSSFVKKFDVDGLKPGDLQSLKSSLEREDANSIFHIDVDMVDEQLMKDMFSGIKNSMSEEDISRYERLSSFGRG